MPVLQGELAGNERGMQAVAILHEFQQILPFRRSQSIQAPIIEDEEIGFGPELEPAQIAAIPMRNP